MAFFGSSGSLATGFEKWLSSYAQPVVDAVVNGFLYIVKNPLESMKTSFPAVVGYIQENPFTVFLASVGAFLAYKLYKARDFFSLSNWRLGVNVDTALGGGSLDLHLGRGDTLSQQTHNTVTAMATVVNNTRADLALAQRSISTAYNAVNTVSDRLNSVGRVVNDTFTKVDEIYKRRVSV